jgi:single-stranded-DNA-specific exonuclease
MKFRWLTAPAQPPVAGQLARQLDISGLLAQCLLNRGLTEAGEIEKFLCPRLKNLADPFLLPGMRTAVERLLGARGQGESLVIFGDYDVDGVTSTSFLLDALQQLGWKVDAYLPHRMDEGYGLSRDGVENCLKKYPVKLLLAVDCGSTAVETILWLRERGVEVLVLDHHQVANPPPVATALVNPQLAGEGERSFRELCSVGLVFKLVHALLKRGRELGLPGMAEFDLRAYLDLVALGTVADLVPLTGENRILVSAGLEKLTTSQRPGLVALKEISQTPPKISVMDVGFQLAPRLNASGRMETAEQSLNLLRAETLEEAIPLAQNLDAQNRERQKIERGMVKEVIALVRAKFKAETDFVIVEGQLPWHLGVVGIVASRVLTEFYRPTIIIGGDGEVWRGSGRSIAGFDLAAALRECDDLLIRHGGHAMAAGLTIAPEKLDQFRERMNELVQRTLRPEFLQAPLRLDAEIKLGELTFEMLAELDQLKPVGQGNPPLQFSAGQLNHARTLQRMGADKQHVKMWVTDGTTTLEAVWWNVGAAALPTGMFDLAFAPAINEFNGRSSVQLKILDWRASAGAVT